MRPLERSGVAEHRAELGELLDGLDLVAIAGGHVAILLNRLRLFDVLPLLAGKTIVAWSAGAMICGERIVLFHDMPPQGPGYAEVLETGLGLYPALLPFPHAHRRLRLSDVTRVQLLSRRFQPAECVALEEGSWLEWGADDGWRAHRGVRQLELNGALREWGQHA